MAFNDPISVVATGSSVSPGPRISLCQKEDLDTYRPSWPQDTASDTIENFAFDERNPAHFFVYPPASTNTYVEVVYVADPVDCASTSSTLSIADQYAPALLAYVMKMALATDVEGGPNLAMVQAWDQEYRNGLDLKAEKATAISPNTADQGGTPSPTVQ